MDKPTISGDDKIKALNSELEKVNKNLFRNNPIISKVNDTRSPQRRMLDRAIGDIGKNKLGQKMLSFAEKIGTGLSKQIQPYFTRFINFVKPRDHDKELDDKYKNMPDFLKTERLRKPDLSKPDDKRNLKALVSAPPIIEITESLSRSSPPKDQILPTSNQSKDKFRSH